MKIQTVNLRQFGHILVTCHPLVMQQILDVLAALHKNNRGDAKATDPYTVCWMFRSGAKLLWRGKSNYSIYCYSHDAGDGLAAVEELKMADHLRLANRHYANHRKLMHSFPIDGKTDALAHSVEWRYVAKAA